MIKQYHEADVDSNIEGFAVIGEDGSNNTLYPIQLGSGVVDKAIRVVHATDSAVSTNIASIGTSIEVKQVSGSSNSVVINSADVTLDVKQVSGSSFSVSTIPLGYSFVNLTSAASSTVVKSGSGVIHTVTINTRGTTSTCKLYDDLTGMSASTIANIDTTLSTTTFIYDLSFTTGLTVVTAGAGAADITVSYY